VTPGSQLHGKTPWDTTALAQGRAGGEAAGGAAAGDGSHPGGAVRRARVHPAVVRGPPPGAIATVLRNLGASTWFQEAFLDLNRRLAGAFSDLGVALNIQHGELPRPDPVR
jgi:hypothetical protein